MIPFYWKWRLPHYVSLQKCTFNDAPYKKKRLGLNDCRSKIYLISENIFPTENSPFTVDFIAVRYSAYWHVDVALWWPQSLFGWKWPFDGSRSLSCTVLNCYLDLVHLFFISPFNHHPPEALLECLYCCIASTRATIRNTAWWYLQHTKCEFRQKINTAAPAEEILVVVIFVSRRKASHCVLFVDTQLGDYSSFTPTADAKTHWGIISRASSYSSNRYVSIAQTGQVVDRNANCLTGWRPHNLHASCCMLTVNNCSMHKTIIMAYSSTPGCGWPWGVFLFSFFFGSIFISWLIHFLCSFHLLSNEKPHFYWWKFGPYTAPLGKWITNHKDKWPAVAADALLRNGIVLLDVYWNKRKRGGDWKGMAVRVILRSTVL